MGRALLQRGANGKIISALNSNDYDKRPKETHSAVLQIDYTDTILAWGMELFHGTSSTFTTGVLCSPINFG